MANRDVMFVRAIELRQVLRGRTVECQLARLNPASAEQTGDERLSERSQIINRIQRRWMYLRLAHGIAECVSEHDLAVFRDEINRGRKVAGVNPAAEEIGNVRFRLDFEKIRHA